MLVLTRKLMERLYIGDDICVTVVRLEGGQVRLGIEAPRSVNVVRAELVPERDGTRPHLQEMRADAAATGPRAGRQAAPLRPFAQAPTRRGSWNR
ncbi:carbon storage regulator [Aquisphaera insulae]|uniref:carbon storage regulator n=1 Tax=Aquisphaera insulae TaxID=2712864 RepID=UPI0013EAF4BD